MNGACLNERQCPPHTRSSLRYFTTSGMLSLWLLNSGA